jgi:hypothetical protein
VKRLIFPVKKLNFFLIGLVSVIICMSSSSCSTQNNVVKNKTANYKAISKQLKKEGFQIVGLLTLENAVELHLQKLSEGSKEIVGTAEGFRTESVGRQVAKNNAIIDYASSESNMVRGRVSSDAFFESVSNTEFEKFYAAYERLIQSNVDKVLTESFSVIKRKDNNNQYRIYYIADESKATTARLNALKNAAAETRLAKEYADEVAKFINEGFNQ